MPSESPRLWPQTRHLSPFSVHSGQLLVRFAPLSQRLSQRPSAFASISRFEKILIALIPLVILGFGALTLQRAAFLKRPQTDIGVYLRAGWAVTAGEDIFRIKDSNGWSYLYPQLIAILAAPLADAPIDPATQLPDERGIDFVPYEISVVVWYALSIVTLWFTAKWLGQAVRLSSPDPRVRNMTVGCRRWWQTMLWPSLICAVAIGSTLVRAQTNTLLAMCIAGMILWTLRGRPFGAGAWIALAACAKVFPAFLGFYALLRRDWKMVAGSVIGTIVLLVIIPTLAVGPQKMWANNMTYLNMMVFQSAREYSAADTASSAELTQTRSKIKELQHTRDNQSLQTIFHVALNPSDLRAKVPLRPGILAKSLHVSVALIMLGFASLAWWRLNRAKTSSDLEVRGFSGYEAMLTIGLLASLMLAISPVCHLHYFVLALPLVAALLAIWKDRSPTSTLSLSAWIFFAIYFLLNLIPRFGEFEALRMTRHLGVAQLGNLMLFAAGIATAFRITTPRQSTRPAHAVEFVPPSPSAPLLKSTIPA